MKGEHLCRLPFCFSDFLTPTPSSSNSEARSTMPQEKQYDVRIERNLLIPLSDGVSLAADLYSPDGPGPFPTLVSYYPYHKDDLIGASFEYPRRYFTERGYANLLVDFRGLGNSD